MCCMICVDVLKEKLTYREVDRNCRELINTPSPKMEHYKTVYKAVSDHYLTHDVDINTIVPKEALRGLKTEE